MEDDHQNIKLLDLILVDPKHNRAFWEENSVFTLNYPFEGLDVMDAREYLYSLIDAYGIFKTEAPQLTQFVSFESFRENIEELIQEIRPGDAIIGPLLSPEEADVEHQPYAVLYVDYDMHLIYNEGMVEDGKIEMDFNSYRSAPIFKHISSIHGRPITKDSINDFFGMSFNKITIDTRREVVNLNDRGEEIREFGGFDFVVRR